MKSVKALSAAAALLCLGMAGCLPRSAPVVATPEYAQTVRSLEKPRADRARLYVFSGEEWGGYPIYHYRSHYISADIFIDDVKIGSVNPSEVLVTDIVPGNHVFRWQEYNRTPSPLGTITPLQQNVEAGTILFLSTNLTKGFAVERGVVDYKLTKDKKAIATDVRIVRPSSCPPTICP
jgi:hypothetical protein